MALVRTLNATWMYHLIALALMVPVPLYNLSDYLLDPEFWAPHHACDTLAIPTGEAIFLMPIWAPLVGGITFVIVRAATRDRVRGENLLIGITSRRPAHLIINVLAAVMIVVNIRDMTWYLSLMMFPQPFETDCSGRAALITGTAQLTFSIKPIFFAVFIWLALHLRALAVSPKRGIETSEA